MRAPRIAAALLATAVALLPALLPGTSGPAAAAQAPPPAPGVREVALTVPTADGLFLPATLHVPTDARPGLPGMVLVHGSGPGERDKYRTEAEAFARAGIATLTYDKRTVGYSFTQRSYSLLADDADAAATLLRGRQEVDPAAVGLWGVSEGGWTVPLAASRAPETAFVVVVAANGVSPLRQQSWADAVELEHAGVRGSLVHAHARASLRLIAGAGLFPEAHYDPVPPLRALTLPVLGLWGAKDRLTPPVESAAAYRDALDEAGNRHYTLRTFAGAEHALHVTTTGFDRGAELAPGYADMVGGWVAAATAGRAPTPSVDGVGEQIRPTAEMPPLAWYESPWMHAGALVVMLVGFAAWVLVPAARRLRGRRSPRATWSEWLLACAGPAAMLGMAAYLLFLLQAGGRGIDPGPLLAGRPLPWLGLQLLAGLAVLGGIAGAIQATRGRREPDRIRRTFLLVAGAFFVPWALWWGLLLP